MASYIEMGWSKTYAQYQHTYLRIPCLVLILNFIIIMSKYFYSSSKKVSHQTFLVKISHNYLVVTANDFFLHFPSLSRFYDPLFYHVIFKAY